MLYITCLPCLAGGSCVIICKIRMIPAAVQFYIIPNMIHRLALAIIHLDPRFFQQGRVCKSIPLADSDAIYQSFVCISLFNSQIVVCILVIYHMLHQIVMQRGRLLLISHIISNNFGKYIVDRGSIFCDAILIILRVICECTLLNDPVRRCIISPIQYIKQIRIILRHIRPDLPPVIAIKVIRR